jgi:hypothetical protein
VRRLHAANPQLLGGAIALWLVVGFLAAALLCSSL